MILGPPAVGPTCGDDFSSRSNACPARQTCDSGQFPGGYHRPRGAGRVRKSLSRPPRRDCSLLREWTCNAKPYLCFGVMLEKGPPLTRENCRVIRCRQEDKPCATNRLPIGFRDVHLQKQSRFYRRRVLETRPTQTSQDVRSALISGISSADDVLRSQVTGSKSLALNLKIGTWVIRDDDLPLFRALSKR